MYTPDGTQFVNGFQTVSFAIDEIPEPVNLELIASNTLNGTISMPRSAAIGDVVAEIVIQEFGVQQFAERTYQRTILDSQSSVDWQFEISPFTQRVRISYRCNSSVSSCTGVFDQSLYWTPTNRFSNGQEGEFPIDEIPDDVDLVLTESVNKRTSLKLINNEVAPDDIELVLGLTVLQASQRFSTQLRFNAVIPSGQSEVELEFGVPVYGDTITLRAFCAESFGTFNRECNEISSDVRFYTPTGIVSDPSQAAFQLSELSDFFEYPIPLRQEIRGQLSLPENFVNEFTTDVRFDVIFQDEQGNTILNRSQVEEIEQGSITSAFTIEVPIGTESLSIAYTCFGTSQRCSGSPLDTRFYRPTGDTIDERLSFFDFGDEPDFVDIVLSEPSSLLGEIRLPIDQLASEEAARFDIFIITLSLDGRRLATNEIEARIPIGQSVTDFSVFYAPFDDQVVYQIVARCRSGCSEFGAAPVYIQANGVATRDEASLALSQFPNRAIFEVVEPDRFEVDDTSAQASLIMSNGIQRHTIHEPGDIDWVRFTVEDTIDLSIVAESQRLENSNPSLTLFDSQLNEIANEQDSISNQEAANLLLSDISVEQVEPGVYFLLVSAQSPGTIRMHYDLTAQFGKAEELCFPVITENGAALICL